MGKELNRQIRRLERFGNDDFQLILMGGERAFATHELHHLLRRLRLTSLRLRKYRRQLFILAAGIPMLLLASVCFTAINQLSLTYLALGFVGLFSFVVAWGQWQLHTQYHSQQSTTEIHNLIQRELARRRSDAEIF